jgi:2-polyprenyl-3-methyl-5-hydroxy-6-metoxy-1,4-benzoquinol methylase
MKAAFLRALARLGLLGAAYRAYERLRAVRGGDSRAPDGLPLPPSRLRVQVAGTADARWFLESGRAAADSMREALERHGRRLEDFGAILDWGCGCGRVIRQLSGLGAELHGSDANPALVGWCRENLSFARFATNEIAPPFRYGDGQFDLVYALSVLTHLPEALQGRWIGELARVVQPGGYVLLSTHGESYVGRLNGEERRAFAEGRLVVRWSQVAGTNLCTAFHPPAYVRDTLTVGWELVELVPEGARGNPHQDLVLLRRP